jgi:hypothetical protein
VRFLDLLLSLNISGRGETPLGVHLGHVFYAMGREILHSLVFTRDGEFRASRDLVEHSDLGVIGDRKPIAILPVFTKHDKVAHRIVYKICRVIWEIFGAGVRILPPRMIEGIDLWSKIDGDLLLDYASKNVDSRVIVVTDADVFSKDNRWVYGYAGIQIPVCTISVHRLDFQSRPVSDESWASLIRLVVHELAHTYGLPHCSYESCIMSRVPEEGLQAFPIHFCATCRYMLSNRHYFGRDCDREGCAP